MNQTDPPAPIRKSSLPTVPPPEWEFSSAFATGPDSEPGLLLVPGDAGPVVVRRLVTYGDWEPVRPDRWADEPQTDVAAAAPAVVAPPTDRADLPEVAAQAIRDSNGTPEALAWWKQHPQLVPAHVYAAAVLAVLGEQTDRAAVLSEAERTMLTYALDQAQERIWVDDGFTHEDQAALDSLRRLAVEAHDTGTQQPEAPDDLATARATNQRLNYEKQRLESELAAYRRAVGQWEVSERGTYIPHSSLRVIGKACGVDILGTVRHLKHFERVEQAEAAIERVRQLHDRLAEETDLTSPDDSITRGAVAKRIAAALDGWNPSGAPQCDVEFEGGGRCAKPAGHRPPGSDDPHVPAPVVQQAAALRAELKPWQLLADAPTEPLPQTERVIGGRRLATSEQQPETEEHSCGNCAGIDPGSCLMNPEQQPAAEAWDVPDARPGTTDYTRQQRQAHAEGEHCFCGPECDAPRCTCADAGDGFVPLGHYRDCPLSDAPRP